MPTGPLAAGLLRGADWFNDALLLELVNAGWPKLSRNQAQVFPLLTSGGVSQSELARGLGITRQSVNSLVKELVALDILTRRSADADARLTLMVLTDRGHRLVEDAARILSTLEAALVDRIGSDAVDALRVAVASDWGEAPAVTRSHRGLPASTDQPSG